MSRKYAASCLLVLSGIGGLLFSAPAWAAKTPEPVVSFRLLTESEYRHSIADIFGPQILVQGR
ncbi:MAG TPA: hypothetical protein VIG39_14400, partial [Rhizomicrobium sp.]